MACYMMPEGEVKHEIPEYAEEEYPIYFPAGYFVICREHDDTSA